MLKAAIAGSPAIAGDSMLSAIIDELDEVTRVRKTAAKQARSSFTDFA